MAPGDFVDGDAEDGGDFLALGWTGGPAAKGDGGDAAFVEADSLGELGDGDLVFLAEVGDTFGHGKCVASDAAKRG